MQLCILLEEKMEPIPQGIKTLFSAGKVGVVMNDGHYVNGDHVLLEGDKDIFINWLKPFDRILKSKGLVMQLQEFEACHVADDV